MERCLGEIGQALMKWQYLRIGGITRNPMLSLVVDVHHVQEVLEAAK